MSTPDRAANGRGNLAAAEIGDGTTSMEPSQPRLIIGMPVYNAARYVASAIDSILAQTFTDFTLMILDNASTDETERICREYAARDPRVVYHRNQTNIGVFGNFRLALSMAPPAEFFKWAAHDDLIGPTYLAKAVALLDQRPEAASCHSATAKIDSDGEIIGDMRTEWPAIESPSPVTRFAGYVLHADPCVDLFAVLRRERLGDVLPFGDFYCSDASFLAELAISGPMLRVDETLFFNRDHRSRVSLSLEADPVSWRGDNHSAAGRGISADRLRLFGRYYRIWWRNRRRLSTWQWLGCLTAVLAAPFRWPEPRTLGAGLLYMISPRLFFGVRRLWRMGRRPSENRA